eukprot:s4617_g1.t2
MAINELLALLLLGPLIQADLRASVAEDVFMMDASPFGGALAHVGAFAAEEMRRHSEQQGYYTALQHGAGEVLQEKGLDHTEMFGKKDKKEKKTREGDRDDRSRKQSKRSRSRDLEDAPEPTKAETGPEAVLGRKDSNLAAEKTKAAWREEMEKVPAGAESDGEAPDGMAMEDDEDADRKVQESRARREALMAKWVNRGERNGDYQPPFN